ncbi:MAG: hypothetical protein ABEK59_07505 [Halobacteria archaeon]
MDDKQLEQKVASVSQSLNSVENLLFQEETDRPSYIERVDRQEHTIQKIDAKLKTLKKRTKRMQFAGRFFTFFLSFLSLSFLIILVKPYVERSAQTSPQNQPAERLGDQNPRAGRPQRLHVESRSRRQRADAVAGKN